MKDRIEELLSQLTIEEKVSLLAGVDHWTTTAVDRLGVPSIRVTDGPNGARGNGASSGPPSACFPCGVALGATWNPELVGRVGEALAEEVKAKEAQVLLAPTVNIHRSPLAGRNFECYSEDPYLTSRMAIAYINGLQNQGVGACIKHFVCNDSEYERMTISSEVRERALREIYLYPFKAAVDEANPWSLMSAYNKINGTWASENPYLLLDVLKDEWGYDGLVMSDWYGTNGLSVAYGGLDLEMPGPARWMDQQLLEELDAGRVTEAMIDDKVRRLLHLIDRVGGFDEASEQPKTLADRPERRQLIREAATEGIVLLKNDFDILPLDPEGLRSLAVIGPNAKHARIMGGGSASVTPYYTVSPYDAIKARIGDTLELGYQIGCSIHRTLPSLDISRLTAEDGVSKGLTLQYFSGHELDGEPTHTQVSRTTNLSWFGGIPEGIDPRSFSLRASATFVPEESGTHVFGVFTPGMNRLLIDGVAVIDEWTLAKVESPFDTGRDEKQVEIEMTAGHPYHIRLEYGSTDNTTWQGVRLGCLPPLPADPMKDAVTLAADADVALIFAGLSREWESEGFDRADMKLPGDQVELIRRVAEVNENTLVVLNSGAPVDLSWIDDVPVVVQVWYSGQEVGNAVADVLFGDADPSGRLPVTYPKRLEDNPAYVNYPGEFGQVYYGEGIFVGYRYYDKKRVEPHFPFGFGMSYTEFAYSNLRLDRDTYGPGDTIHLAIDVENVGQRAGKEVVQVYIEDVVATVSRPIKELKAFAKLHLAPGESKSVSFALRRDALAYYSPIRKKWLTETGEFRIHVGRSAGDIRLTGSFTWEGDAPLLFARDSRLHVGLTLGQLLADDEGMAVLKRHLPAVINHPETRRVLDVSLEQVAKLVPQQITPETLLAINDDLAEIE